MPGFRPCGAQLGLNSSGSSGGFGRLKARARGGHAFWKSGRLASLFVYVFIIHFGMASARPNRNFRNNGKQREGEVQTVNLGNGAEGSEVRSRGLAATGMAYKIFRRNENPV